MPPRAGAAGRFPGTCLGKRQGPRLQPGEGVSPGPAPLTPLRGSATGALPPGCTASGGRQGPLRGPRAPAPLHWPLLPSSAPLDSFPSAPWAHRSRLRTGSYSALAGGAAAGSAAAATEAAGATARAAGLRGGAEPGPGARAVQVRGT